VNYYNDNDRAKAELMRSLIESGLIPPGDVDERSIADVQASDLDGYTQVHFFAGIAGWSLALDLAGWPTDRHVWTGSAPCQPFSNAGLRRGEDDERHLWPELWRLIRECRPDIVLGEQVDSADGLGWLDGVSADLEASAYAVGAAVLPAAGVGAPHQRHRIYWVAKRLGKPEDQRHERSGTARRWRTGLADDSADDVGLDDTGCIGDRKRNSIREAGRGVESETGEGQGAGTEWLGPRLPVVTSSGLSGGLGHADGARQPGRPSAGVARQWTAVEADPWSNSRIVWCDEREFGRGWVARRASAEPGDEPLAARLPARLGPGASREERLGLVAAKAYRKLGIEGYGDAIVPQVAALFVRAVQHGT
jgi:DNA (cytosine-5)-methyltransferase 1